MNNKEELKSEELEKVTGGTKKPGIDGIDTGGRFSCFVDMYNLTPGNEYYFVHNKSSGNTTKTFWFRARVKSSYEENLYTRTRHRHKLTVTDEGSYIYKGDIDICSDEYAAYIEMNWD